MINCFDPATTVIKKTFRRIFATNGGCEGHAMNKLVRENYPASRLPEDLREGIDPANRVTVTVVEEAPPHVPMTLDEIRATRRPPFRSAEEIVASIRQMRDEWDD